MRLNEEQIKAFVIAREAIRQYNTAIDLVVTCMMVMLGDEAKGLDKQDLKELLETFNYANTG